jgi:hypothetical protein
MARIHRNGNLIIRVSDIALCCIKSNNPTNVEIGLKTGHSVNINCKTEEEALNYLDTLKKLMEGR